MSPAVILAIVLVAGSLFGVLAAALFGGASSTPTPTPPTVRRPRLTLITERPPMTNQQNTPTLGIEELRSVIRARRPRKRQLVNELAVALHRLDVRTAGMARVVDHNAELEARLRTMAVVAAAGGAVPLDQLSPILVTELNLLGDEYGRAGVIAAAITVLGGR